MTTAEWKCTACGATNRKLVSSGTTAIVDRCVSCHTPHEIRLAPRPPFWEAVAKP